MKKFLQIFFTVFFALTVFMVGEGRTSVNSVSKNIATSDTTMIFSASPAENILNGTFAIQPTVIINSAEKLRDRRRLHHFYNLCFSFVFTLGTLAVFLIVKFYSALLRKEIADFVLDKNLATQSVSRTQIHNTVLLI